MPKDGSDIGALCASLLASIWQEIADQAAGGSLTDVIGEAELREAIHLSVNSPTKSYRYVLPTQTLAKLADSTLDCRSIQASGGGEGAFDARSLCQRVIVPFDRDNNSVLGGSTDPYVNNPLRVPGVSLAYSSQQKNKAGWAMLADVLDRVEEEDDPAFTRTVVVQLFIEIHRRLSDTHITYPIPRRISLEHCLELVTQFLGAGSGGDRAQAVASALFLTIGQRFGLFTDVRRSHTNTADTASGQMADLECVTADGAIALAVEVKDKALVLREVQDKLPMMRAQRVSEFIFLALRGVASSDEPQIAETARREFASGHNIYVVDDVTGFMRAILALLGEDGRRQFLERVGQELDAYRSDMQHRRAWADALARH